MTAGNPASKGDLYAELGVSRDATPAAIKAAYRLKAKDAHPDSGGTDAAFQAVAQAHRILSDPEKRKRYDETGSVDDNADRTKALALQMIHAALGSFMGDDSAIYRDLVAETRANVAGEMRAMEVKIASVRENIRRAERMRARFRAKKGPDFIGEMIDAQIVGANDMVRQIGDQITVAKLALEILDDAEFNAEVQPNYAARPNIFNTSLGGMASGRPLGR